MKLIITTILSFFIASTACIGQSTEIKSDNKPTEKQIEKKEKSDTRTVKAKFDKEGNIISQTSEQKTRTVKAKVDKDGKVTGEKEKQKTKKVKVKFDKEGNEIPEKGKRTVKATF